MKTDAAAAETVRLMVATARTFDRDLTLPLAYARVWTIAQERLEAVLGGDSVDDGSAIDLAARYLIAVRGLARRAARGEIDLL